MDRIRYIIAFASLAAVFGHGAAFGKGSVVNSPHNLSASGGGGKHGIMFAQEQRICVFCHVPHNANPAGPLWSRGLPPESIYIKPYDSSTIKAIPKPDKPTGPSRLCLSCHDGTIALAAFQGSTITGANATLTMPTDIVPTRNPNLTTDLSDDHPISFGYTDSLAAAQGELAYPETLPAEVRLEGGQVLQCTSCHDPHNNEFGNFLVINNNLSGAPLCVACHKNAGWNSSTHNPAASPTLTAACMNCHYVHSAPGPERLLHYRKVSDNCYLSCHNGNDTASVNVRPLFNLSMHRHPIDLSLNVHDESESLPATTYHVECVDCHNSHQVNNTGTSPLASPPYINGKLAGIKKDQAGNIATKEYEVCFKCHAGVNAFKFSGVTETPANRMVLEPDEMKRFDYLNTASYHPVMGDRKSNGASLLSPIQQTMLKVYCSDCHNSEQSKKAGGSGASGPHGSLYPHILLSQYYMPSINETRQLYSASQYDLCYRCHAESFIMGSSSGFVKAGVSEHARHVTDPTRLIPCYVCHDPHGISLLSLSVPLPSATNNAHLINFQKDYTVSAAVPNPVYTSTGVGSGNCTTSCHGNDAAHSYP
ncbi:MAG TPA: cytochrome c3 family protein [Geobacteraceae bacterium]|nr:cytochrome c3 family protein [Geobacteraceae bacterium]